VVTSRTWSKIQEPELFYNNGQKQNVKTKSPLAGTILEILNGKIKRETHRIVHFRLPDPALRD